MSRPRKGKRQKALERLERERQEKRDRRKPKRSRPQTNILPADPIELCRFILDPRRLTTPKTIDGHVMAFCRTIHPEAEPIPLRSRPEGWSRQGCCDLNVKRFIESHGGKMVCGYRIWYHAALYIEAERHAVWRSDEGQYRDISFSPDGETSIVFIPDVPEKQLSLDQNADKIPHAVDPRVRPVVQLINRSYRIVRIDKLDDEEAWKTMPTYADWKKGIRKQTMRI